MQKLAGRKKEQKTGWGQGVMYFDQLGSHPGGIIFNLSSL